MEKNEKISLALSVFGVVIASIALGVSIWGHVRTNDLHEERMIFDEKLRMSKVVLKIGRNLNQNVIVFKESTNVREGYGASYEQEYNLIIDNIGFQSASITSWDVSVKSQMLDPDTGKNMYSNVNFKIFDNKGNLVELPISIKPKQPRKLTLIVNVKIAKIAWNSVANKLKFGEKYNYNDTDKIFNNRGYPEFGQLQINQILHGKELSRTDYGPGPYMQDFHMYLIKGDGTQVKAVFSHHINDFFIQGENSGTFWEDVSGEM